MHRDEVKKSKALRKENAALLQKYTALEAKTNSPAEEKSFAPEKGQVERAAQLEEENAGLLNRLDRLEKESAQKEARIAAWRNGTGSWNKACRLKKNARNSSRRGPGR